MRHKFLQLTNKSFEEFGVATYKDLWAKAQEKGFTALETSFVTVFTKDASSDNTFHAVLSDSMEDRHGDIVIQDWVLTNFKKNAVLLDSHDYSSIEYIIGKWSKIAVKDGLLQGDIEFALSNPRGLLAYNLAKDGFLSALSAGFIPLEFDQKNGNITKSELLEGSMVSVPANPRTLIEKTIVQKKEGDKCEMPDGSMGEMHPDDSGEMVCMMPKKKDIDKSLDPPFVPAPAATVQKKSMIVLLNEKLKSKEAILRAVAVELKGVTPENINERKRRMWKSLRTAI